MTAWLKDGAGCRMHVKVVSMGRLSVKLKTDAIYKPQRLIAGLCLLLMGRMLLIIQDLHEIILNFRFIVKS